jgi:hypothetical protein
LSDRSARERSTGEQSRTGVEGGDEKGVEQVEELPKDRFGENTSEMRSSVVVEWKVCKGGEILGLVCDLTNECLSAAGVARPLPCVSRSIEIVGNKLCAFLVCLFLVGDRMSMTSFPCELRRSVAGPSSASGHETFVTQKAYAIRKIASPRRVILLIDANRPWTASEGQVQGFQEMGNSGGASRGSKADAIAQTALTTYLHRLENSCVEDRRSFLRKDMRTAVNDRYRRDALN